MVYRLCLYKKLSMPLGVQPTCSLCETSDSLIWRKNADGEVMCNSCVLKPPSSKPNESKADSNDGSNGLTSSQNSGPVRKSTRVKPSKYRSHGSSKSQAAKGKNRRLVFKKNPMKAPTAVATVITRECVFHDGIYWQVGDIASVMDDDGWIFYAQMIGFLEDQYCEKSAVINWLLPTTSSPKDQFDPSTFILGPAEELPRSLDAFEFVCRAPSNYYRLKCAPYEVELPKPELGYVWTRLGPQIRPVPSHEEIFGVTETEEIPEETDSTVGSRAGTPSSVTGTGSTSGDKRSRKSGKSGSKHRSSAGGDVKAKQEPV